VIPLRAGGRPQLPQGQQGEPADEALALVQRQGIPAHGVLGSSLHGTSASRAIAPAPAGQRGSTSAARRGRSNVQRHPRWDIERLFRRVKAWRRVFTRYDKTDVMFAAFITAVLIAEALRSVNIA